MQNNHEATNESYDSLPLSSIEENPDEMLSTETQLQASFRPTDAIAKFTYKNKTYKALAKNVTPSELAKRFKIKVDGIQVKGKDKEYKVIRDKDIFCPLLAPASYEIVYDPKDHIASIIEIKSDSKHHHNSSNNHSNEGRERAFSDSAVKKSHHSKDAKVRIIFNEKQFEENILNAQPSEIAKFFEIELTKLKLKKKNTIYEVNENKGCFEPELVPGKYHLLSELKEVKSDEKMGKKVELKKADEKMGNNGLVQEVKEKEICFIVCKNGIINFDCNNDSMETLLQGIGENDLSDFQLLAENGSIIDLTIIPKLIKGNIYYVSNLPENSTVDLIRFPNTKHFYAGLTLNRPMAFMAPYLIAILRAISIISHVGNQIPLKSTKHEHAAKRHNLISVSTLSTAAYQISYRINDVAKALQLITNKIANDKVDCIESENEFEENNDQTGDDGLSEFVIDFPGCNLDPVLKLLKKALFETEDFLELIVESMKEKQSTAIKTVETALIMEKGKHQRREQKITFENIVDENDDGEYREIAQKDYRIIPNTTVAEISHNRKHFDCINQLITKIIKDSTSSDGLDFNDVANLINISAEVLHSIFLHWRFFQEFLNYQDAYFGKDQKRLSASDVCLTVSQQLKSCAIMWNFVGRTLPFFTDLESDKKVSTLWETYLKDINAAQYSLEICYLTKKYTVNN